MKSWPSLILFWLTGMLLLLPFGYSLWLVYGDRIYLFLNQRTRTMRQELKLAAPPLAWLSTQDRFMVDEVGNKKILRGVNVGSINWGKESWNDQAVEEAITNWQAKVIRTRIFQDEYEVDPEVFLAKIERQIIEPARKHGVYVILHPWIHDNQSLPDEGTIKMWTMIAQRYKDDPTILYDVLAEPHNVSAASLREAYEKLIQAIRGVHPKSLIFVSGLNWGREINSWLDNPLPYPNLVYRSNPYNKPGEFEGLFGQIAQRYPVFLGEFGADSYPPMSKEAVKALLEYAEQLGIGWTAWNFSADGCPCLLADEKEFTPSAYGQIVKSFLAKPLTIPPDVLPKESNPQIDEIYTDSLEHGFIDYSWGTQVDLVNHEPVFSGQKSLKIAFQQPQAGFFINTSLPIDLANYRTLSFWVEAEAGVPSLEIYLKTEAEQVSPKLMVVDYQGEQQGKWVKIEIPLNQFGLGNGQLNSLFIGNTQDKPIKTVIIDQIQLEK